MGKKAAGRVRVKQVGPKAPVNPLEALSIPPEEMIHLPPKRNSNIAHIWPMSETFTMDYKQFSVIYPSYLDSNKTVKRGRRISAEYAIPAPSVIDLSEALASMGIRHVVQPYKGFSRDIESQWDNLGRVMVDTEIRGPMVFDADDMPELSDTTWNKKVLMREMATRIKSLPSRIKRLEEEERKLEEIKAQEAATTKVVAQKVSTTGTTKKKKGKKK